MAYDTIDTFNNDTEQDQGGSYFSRLPSYMVAADNHQVANGDLSGEQIVKGVAGVGAGALAGAAIGQAAIPIPIVGAAIGGVIGAYAGWETGTTEGNWAKATVYSAANSFYNTGITISNAWKSEDDKIAQRTTEDWIAEKDDDLLTYYEDNKEKVDLAGFVVGSLVPGTAALKTYNWATRIANTAKIGKLGLNMEYATGLLKPMQGKYLALAKTEIEQANTVYSMINGNTIKALAAGAGEQAIQAAVFETAIAASMFESPIMQHMDVNDMASNVLHAAMFGGAIGGVLEGVIGYTAIKGAKVAAESALMPYNRIHGFQPGTPLDTQILMHKRDLFDTLAAKESSEFAQLSAKYGQRAATVVANKETTLANEIRTKFRELSSDDEIGNILTDIIDKDTNLTSVGSKVSGLIGAHRISSISKQEQELIDLTRKINKGVTEPAIDYAGLDKYSVTYMRLWGHDAGAMLDSVDAVSLADTLKQGQKIEILNNGVKAGNNFYAHNVNKPIDMITASSEEIEARWLHAIHSGPLHSEAIIDAFDIPNLAKAVNEWDANSKFKIKFSEGEIVQPASREELIDLFSKQQDAYVAKLYAADPAINNITVAKRANLKLDALEGTAVNTENPLSDRFAMQSYASEAAVRLGVSPDKANNLLLKPQHIKLIYDNERMSGLDYNVMAGMASIKQQQVILKQTTNNVLATVLPDLNKELIDIPEDLVLKANPFEASAGLTSFVDAGYGSLASMFQKVGQITNRHMRSATDAVEARLQPLLVKLHHDKEAMLEASILFNKMRGPDAYVLNDAGDGLIMRGIKLVEEARAEGKKVPDYQKLDTTAEEQILFKSRAVRDLVTTHIGMNGIRVDKFKSLRNLGGLQDTKDPNVFYAPPVDTTRYPHFAIVSDPQLTGTGHKKMIYAATEKELDQMISRVNQSHPEFEVLKNSARTKNEIEAFKRAMGEYNADLAINDNYMDAAMARSGVSMNYLPVTDAAKFSDELLRWHMDKERQLIREGVSTKYAKEFYELERLGNEYTNITTSRFSPKNLVSSIGDTVKNPYKDYIKLALDISQGSNTPIFTSLNIALDSKVSRMHNDIFGVMSKTKSVEELDQINEMFRKHGVKTAYYDAALDLLANSTASRGVLTRFVTRANALLASTVLGDVLNAANNIVGMSILTAPELSMVTNAIKLGSAEAVGDLAKLSNIAIPGTERSILAPKKLMSRAVANWFNKELRDQARAEGAITRHAQEVHAIYDELSLRGAESVAELDNKLGRAYNFTMQKLDWLRAKTGNSFAEEFTRFIAWDSMRQITDLAESYGVLEPSLGKAYRNTFVNRTQGNYLASQRPLAFSGPIGQGIGLFQTYQFNMLQSMFRNVAAGNKKQIAMMLGLQSTIYGAHTLPGFQAINASLIGGAAGNPEHIDAYSTTSKLLNHQAMEWLMYGAASNALGLFHPDLKINMYTRGDINPRNTLIVPTSIDEIPLVNGTAKLIGGMLDTADRLVQNGGHGDPARILLQGIEHAGINRSLAGIAQVAEGFFNQYGAAYSTSRAGNISAAHDMFTLASLGRIAGGKPLDEALQIDEGFRLAGYQAKDQARISRLGEVIKSKLIANGKLDKDELPDLAERYVASGGNQQNFNKWVMGLYKNANTAQANQIASQLNSIRGQRMQELMGGRVRDFSKPWMQE